MIFSEFTQEGQSPLCKFRLLYNHHDQVVTLPFNAVRLATSDFCVNEAFIVGDYAIGIQGHPEYTVEYATHLLKNHSQGEDKAVVKAALASIKKYGKELDNQVLINAINYLVK